MRVMVAESISDPIAEKRTITELWLALSRKWGDIFKAHLCKCCYISYHVF